MFGEQSTLEMFNRLEMSGEETQASETSPKGSDSEVQNGIGLSGITIYLSRRVAG